MGGPGWRRGRPRSPALAQGCGWAARHRYTHMSAIASSSPSSKGAFRLPSCGSRLASAGPLAIAAVARSQVCKMGQWVGEDWRCAGWTKEGSCCRRRCPPRRAAWESRSTAALHEGLSSCTSWLIKILFSCRRCVDWPCMSLILFATAGTLLGHRQLCAAAQTVLGETGTTRTQHALAVHRISKLYELKCNLILNASCSCCCFCTGTSTERFAPCC